MKTLFLFEDDSGVHFFELPGDLSRFHDVYINGEIPEGVSHEQHSDLQDELALLVYGAQDEKGLVSGDLVPEEIEAPTKDWDHFVHCGCCGFVG